jgi:alkylation response protein AidB-like acyl-CoA dehydrogenase
LSDDTILKEWYRSNTGVALSHAQSIADYCATNADTIDFNGAFPEREFKLIAESGLLAVPLRQELGGWGAGINANVTSELLTLLKRIGYGNLSVGRIYEGHVNALQLIQTFGSKEQVALYARDASVHHKIFGVWNAEAEDGVKIIPLSNGKYRLEG